MNTEKDTILESMRRESINVYANSDVMQPFLFDSPNKAHDWRNHVPEAIRDIWDNLTERERRLVMIACERAANNESWN